MNAPVAAELDSGAGGYVPGPVPASRVGDANRVTGLMHTVTYGTTGSYPRTVCGLHLGGRDPVHRCGPRYLGEHCARLKLEPCQTCWPPAAPSQLPLWGAA